MLISPEQQPGMSDLVEDAYPPGGAASVTGQPSSTRAGAAENRLRVHVVSAVPLYANLVAAELSRYPHLDARPFGDMDAEADAVLVECRRPEDVTVLRHWCDRCRGAAIIAFAIEERPEHVLACVEAGAVAYVPGDATVAELVTALERARRGEAWCAPAIAGSIFRRVAALARELTIDPLAATLLTPREREVAELLTRGLSNKEIARRLGVTSATVKSHVHHVLRKVGRNRRTTLISAGTAAVSHG